MTTYEIWLIDNENPIVQQTMFGFEAIVRPVKIVATIELEKPFFKVGQLKVTPAALAKYGILEVREMFKAHLYGQWGAALDKQAKRENDQAAKKNQSIYDRPDDDSMIVSYPGHDTTLILREEY